MIRWILTTIILVIVVAVLTVILQTPSLRNKSEKWFKEKTSLMEKRAGEVKDIIESKGDSKQTGPGQAKTETVKKTEPVVKEIPGSTAKPVEDQIPESDKKKLEQVLEKANKKPVKKKQ